MCLRLFQYVCVLAYYCACVSVGALVLAHAWFTCACEYDKQALDARARANKSGEEHPAEKHLVHIYIYIYMYDLVQHGAGDF